jgi:hypothetical protein
LFCWSEELSVATHQQLFSSLSLSGFQGGNFNKGVDSPDHDYSGSLSGVWFEGFFLDAKLCDDDAPPHSLKVSGCKAM